MVERGTAYEGWPLSRPLAWGGGRRVALVIGNAAYPSAPLRNPCNDAKAFAAKLGEVNPAFHVTLRLDVSRDDMEDALETFEGQLVDADTALLFFAGHGLQVKGVNFLMPVDAEIRQETHLRRRAFALNEILDIMGRRVRSSSLVFLDACRDNPFARSLLAGFSDVERGGSLTHSGLAEIRADAGSFIAFATAPDNVALDGSGDNSPFTTALVEHLATPNTSISDVMIAVRQDVWKATNKRQMPWDQSSLHERFIFHSPPPTLPERDPAPGGIGDTDTAEPRDSPASPEPGPLEIAIGGSGQKRTLMPGSGKTQWFIDREHSPEMIVVPAAIPSPIEIARKVGSESTYGPRRPFAVSRFPITVDQFSRFIADSNYDMPPGLWVFEGIISRRWRNRSRLSYRDPGFPQDGTHPVVGVNWFDALAYAAWLTKTTTFPYRLLTEFEWRYSVGQWTEKSAKRYAEWSEVDIVQGTVPVDSFEAGPWGIYRQSGRVWEWCSDHWQQAPPELPAPPGNFDEGVRLLRELRAGILHYSQDNLAEACKRWGAPIHRVSICGLRVARDLI